MGRFKKLLREPLHHFLALGAGLFTLFGGGGAGERPDEIVVSAGQIDHLVEIWMKTWQRPPTYDELQGLIEDRVMEEVLYREALALGLDRDDVIIRRRLRQKMEFIADDFAATAEPTDDELEAFLDEHPELFMVDARLTFRQIYLNQDRRGATARQDAERLLVRLANDAGVDAEMLGDPLSLPHAYASSSQTDVARLFGREFAEGLLELEPGSWTGPIRSGYGLHLVRVDGRTDGRMPELSEVRDAVKRDWFAARRREAKEALYGRLRERYTVTVETPDWADPSAQTVAGSE